MKKTMKLIDLIIKIENNEEVPKKIKYRDSIYNFKGFLYKLDPSCLYPHIVTNDYLLYRNVINNYILNNWNFSNCIDDEVEILEEEIKLPEKLGKIEDNDGYIDQNDVIKIGKKVDEIINYLKNKEKGE